MKARDRLRERRRPTADERGVVLIVALLVTVLLALLGVSLLSMSATENTIAYNEVNTFRAFDIAEAGIEHARQQLLGTNIDPLLEAGGTLFSNEALGGGSYSVTVSNNTNPPFPKGDLPADPGGADDDTDGFLFITSTGTYQNASRTIEVVVRPQGIVFPGAIYLPGTAPDIETKFGGDLFDISGNDTMLDGNPGSCAAKPGIATTDAVITTQIIDGDMSNGGLAPFQFDNVIGAGSAPSVQTTSTVYDVQATISNLLTSPHTPISKGNINTDATWGTDAAPQITYIDRKTTQIKADVSGSGILIVNGTLKVMKGGNFDFHGLVIVFDEVSLQPDANVDIRGMLWLNESPSLPPNRPVELDPQGPADIKYSCEALNMVNANWGMVLTGGGGNKAWPILSWQERN